ncbi:hypothetical protein LguiA_005604 [Lonicera macranthoides]
MADSFSYPPIDPTTFDLIIIGTGLPESVIAAASSTAGKSVLHLDPHPFYGSHFSSLPLHDFTSFLHSQSQPNPIQSCQSDCSDYSAVDLTVRRMYSDVEITSHSSELLELSRKFNLDLAGPRVLFCADSAVDLMLKSGASQYTEFKNVDASLVYDDGSGKLWNVPDSRSAIFKDRSLKYSEKNQLMSFFKLVQGHLESVGSDTDAKKISDEDLEKPFAEFLNKMRLPVKLKSIILYAIAMADYDQDNAEICQDILKTKDGIDRLALYHSSIGRFPNALGALIYPIYGQGELPQAFCRRAAVKGCLYVLRMPVIALLMDKCSGNYKGIKLSSGQEIFSHQLVLDPSFTVPSSLADSPSNILRESSFIFGQRDVKGKVARGICITNSSVKPDVSSCLVFYPPRSLYPEQVTSVRVLQIGSNLAVCPSGMFVFYLSALCEDAVQGKKLLHAAINALFSVPISASPEDSSTNQSDEDTKEVKPAEEDTEEVKPALLWAALYMQELTMGSLESVSSTPMPDANLNYNDLLQETMKLFQKMYPNEEFFPVTASSEKHEDDDGGELDLESV